MSRPRSCSPRSRRLPWEEPDFDPYKVLSKLDGNPIDKIHRSREFPEEYYFRKDLFREGQRRPPYYPNDHQFRNQHPSDQKGLYRHHHHQHVVDHEDQRFSPMVGPGGEGERRRGGFREQFQSSKNRKSHYPALDLERERSLAASQSHSDHRQRGLEMGWKRERRERGQERFRDPSPSARFNDKRGGTDREKDGGRNAQVLDRGKRREEPHQERNPASKRQRRDMDDANHLGYRNEENFGDQRYKAREGCLTDHQASMSHVDNRDMQPLIIEHDHGITDGRGLPRWEQFYDNKGADPELGRQRFPRLMGSSQERFRTSNNKLEDEEDTRRYRNQDHLRSTNAKYLETRRSPVQQDRPNTIRLGNQDGPTNQKGRSGPHPARGRLNYGQGARTGPPRTQQPCQQGSRGFQEPSHKEQKPAYQPLREKSYVAHVKHDRNWAEEQGNQRWEHTRSGSLDQQPSTIDLDPKMPRQRQRAWTDQKTNNMTVVTEETLTVKVDMSRPVNSNSSLCYSSDRQLSLDLVNVGRQRLDFLPMLEHSGTYRETAVHTGTFAQEIITLVHQVKEQYFKDEGITLNERFSAPQTDGFAEQETEEMTLNKRFSSNRGFSLNTTSLLDDDGDDDDDDDNDDNVPLFSRLGPIQDLNQLLVRDPGDLRHNLERRRQERLEGVKVTIQGNSMRAMNPVSELDYSDTGDLAQMEDGEFSILLQDQSRRREANMAQRRTAPFRTNSGPQRRNNRGGNQGGQMRRQNNRNNPTGPHW